jgi:uncharacterized membrane protein
MRKPRDLWTDLRSSFWFVPAVIVGAAVALALVLIETDRMLLQDVSDSWPRLFGAGAAGSRGMLSTIAGSMITVAGVVFSITIVSLSLASSQYSSRVLRNFMRDRTNQTVLGVFVGIFAYCLVVLRTIRGGDEGAFVPALAVLVAVALAFVGIAFLIVFIDHIGRRSRRRRSSPRWRRIPWKPWTICSQRIRASRQMSLKGPLRRPSNSSWGRFRRGAQVTFSVWTSAH